MILTSAQQDLIEDSFETEEVTVFEDSVEIGSGITFSRLKALVEILEDCGGVIETEEVD